MFAFLKKLFGFKPTEVAPAPYKIDPPAVKPAVKKTARKPAVKKATTRKPRAPRA